MIVMLSGVEGGMNPEGRDEIWLSGVEGGHGGMNPEGRDELPPVDAATDGEAMAQGSFGDPLLVGDLSPMARHRPLAQCSMGHKDDGQVDAPRRKHRLYSQTCLECQRNNDAVKMLLKDTIKIKRSISASLLFSRDFKKTAMENNDKRLSYKAAPPEARSAWEKLSEQEKEPYIKEYRRRYVEWKKSSVMAPQLDGTPPQVYTTPGQAPVPCGTLSRLKGIASMRTEAPGVDTKIQKVKMMQNLVKEVDCQPDKQQNELLSSGGIIQKTDRLLNVQQNLVKGHQRTAEEKGWRTEPEEDPGAGLLEGDGGKAAAAGGRERQQYQSVEVDRDSSSSALLRAWTKPYHTLNEVLVDVVAWLPQRHAVLVNILLSSWSFSLSWMHGETTDLAM